MHTKLYGTIVSIGAILGLLACGGTSTTDGGITPEDGSPPDTGAPPTLPSELGPADRRAPLTVPSAHDGVTPLPVVILLHGYSASGGAQELYFGLRRAARRAGFFVIVPDGTRDAAGNRFWNATDVCCDFANTGVDDVGYLIGLVDELESLTPVGRVFFMGHSNGGFMSYRMACEHADRVSGIATLAGSDFAEDDACVPERGIAVLHVHGDADTTIRYEGGTLTGGAGTYPGAEAVTRRWAERAGCDAEPTEGPTLDLESVLPGEETTTFAYSGCDEGAAELWRIRDGSHIPSLQPDFSERVLTWLEEHTR